MSVRDDCGCAYYDVNSMKPTIQCYSDGHYQCKWCTNFDKEGRDRALDSMWFQIITINVVDSAQMRLL